MVDDIRLCEKCNKFPARAGKAHCERCAEYFKDYYRNKITSMSEEELEIVKLKRQENYRKRLSTGICISCGKRPVYRNLVRCFECELNMIEYQKRRKT